MVGFLLFFLMIRFDQVFHLMIFFFTGLTFILPDCKVDICPS
jgi:hypothetical protein